jgi:outer membrane protein TolC
MQNEKMRYRFPRSIGKRLTRDTGLRPVRSAPENQERGNPNEVRTGRRPVSPGTLLRAFFALFAPSRLPLIGLAFFAGCDFHNDPARYRAILDGKHPTTLPAYASEQRLTLRRALQLANADDEAIGITGENYIQALAQKMKDAGNFLPTLTLGPTYSLSKSNGGGGFSFAGGSSSSNNALLASFFGSSSQSGISHEFEVPLGTSFTGSLANVSTYEAAGQTAQQQAMLLLNERETILLQVAQSYYTCLKAERQVSVYERSVESKAEKVRDQEARLKLGAVRPLDVASSQSDLAATRVSLTQARVDAANARSALARLMGVDQVRGELVDDFQTPVSVPTLDAWQMEGFKQRQDLVAAVRAKESARLKVDGAIREYFPSVTINFNYILYYDPTSSQVWTNGITGNVPIFSALSIEGDVRAAWSLYRQAGLTESQTRRQVLDDVNEGYENLQNAREQVAELQVEVQAARQAADLAERSYQLGSLSNVDRLTQQDNYLTAQLNLLTEQFSEKTSYLNLLRATGQLATMLKDQPATAAI